MEEDNNLWNTTQSVAETIILAANSEFEDRPCNENDFTDFKPQVEARLFHLINQIKSVPVVSMDNCHPDIKKSVVATLLACGEHSENYSWTSELSVQLSSQIQKLLCQFCQCDSIKQLVCSLFKQCLSVLRVKLARDTWRQYPGAVASFQWLIFQVEMPKLGEHMTDIFPATLLILDDFDVKNKVIGCHLMHHIISNVTRAEMRRQQYDDVVYDVLHRLMYQRDAELVVPLVTCLSSLLSKMDSSFTQNLEMKRLDRSLLVLMGHMEMEQVLTFRQVYAVALPMMLGAGGLSLVRWSQRLLRITAEYLAMEDGSQGQTQLHTLQALHCLLRQTWPRAYSLVSQVLSTLLKLVVDLTQTEGTLVMDQDTKLRLLSLTEECLELVVVADPKKCQELLSGSQNLPFSSQFQDIVNRMQEKCRQ